MKILRWFLLPFSVLYGIITFLRNKLYDWGWFSSYLIPVKSICVGNLSIGGTGKTPHVLFLAEFLSREHKVNILSRGYGRKTKGYYQVTLNLSADTTGDEPMMYKAHFGDRVKVSVCEKRADGVQTILKNDPDTDVILLDDAFQHRAIKAGLNILLTDYSHPFSKDIMLPTGNLREWKSGRNRADLIIVTKCPSQITNTEKEEIRKSLKFDKQKIFFSSIEYLGLAAKGKIQNDPKNVILVSGIANSLPLKNYLSEKYKVEELKFKDHHAFSYDDLRLIHQKFDNFASDHSILITTEKDFVRLKDLLTEADLEKYPWYVQPISIRLDEEKKFKEIITNYVDTI